MQRNVKIIGGNHEYEVENWEEEKFKRENLTFDIKEYHTFKFGKSHIWKIKYYNEKYCIFYRIINNKQIIIGKR